METRQKGIGRAVGKMMKKESVFSDSELKGSSKRRLSPGKNDQ